MKTSVAVMVCVLASGCATTEQRHNLVSKRAVFDLNCNEPVQITELGNRIYGASGCGRRATYVMQCYDSNIGSCTAILNSDSKSESKQP
jgi:hypothetical protein